METELVDAPKEQCCTARTPAWYENMKWRILRNWEVLQYKLHLKTKPESNSVSFAKRELQAIGYKLDETEEGPNKWIVENVLELLNVFAEQGHSGFSAPYCIDMFSKLAKFEPLGPLTGEDDEWIEHDDNWFQNKRCGHVFKKNGVAYDGEGYIFWSWYERALQADEEGYPGTERYKSNFSSYYSRKAITFPYTPVTEYIEVQQRETNREGTALEPGSGWWETDYPQNIIDAAVELEFAMYGIVKNEQ